MPEGLLNALFRSLLLATVALVLAPRAARAEEAAGEVGPIATTRAGVFPFEDPKVGGGTPEVGRSVAAQPGCQLQYRGGPLITNVEVVAVSWSNAVDARVAATLPAFYRAVTNSTHFDWLTEYNSPTQGIGRGTFKTQVTISPSASYAVVDDSVIGREILAQIAAGVLPRPTYDAQGNTNTIYMVNFPPGVQITFSAAGTSCQPGGFCAYHHSIVDGAGRYVHFGVLPDMSSGPCSLGCGHDPDYVRNQTAIISHELVEAVTDPIDNSAWVDPSPACGEIGDICKDEIDTVRGFAVQKEWSNRMNACIAVLPGASKGCSSSAECGGSAPICSQSGMHQGECVACESAAQCSGSAPTCDDATGQCRACMNDNDCGATGTRCAISGPHAGACIAPTGAAATCDPASGSCTSCKTDDDCVDSPSGNVCSEIGVCGTADGSPQTAEASAAKKTAKKKVAAATSGCAATGRDANGWSFGLPLLLALAARSRRRRTA